MISGHNNPELGPEGRTAPEDRGGNRKPSIRLLHIEDSPADAELIHRELRKAGYALEVRRVETGDAMRAALRDQTWDLILSDHHLPTFSAPEAFAILRESGIDLPFIIVSGTVGEEVAVQAMRAGAQDYLLKGNLRRLVVAVERELRDAAVRAEQRRAQQQLMISERLASVGTLAAGVAHEINNPLLVVMSSLACALDDVKAGAAATVSGAELAEQLRGPLEDAQEAVERVRLIVRDLRVFSRAEAETRAPVDVRKVLDSAERMARHELMNRARLVRRYGEVAPVYGNEARLGQVFLNLIVNAAQAMPTGSSEANTITLTTRQEGNEVVVEVTDTGSGIPPEILPRVFDVFFTTKPVGVGTGLGLAICHQIVTGMNGKISVESTPGHGTTFRVVLPEAPASVRESHETRAKGE